LSLPRSRLSSPHAREIAETSNASKRLHAQGNPKNEESIRMARNQNNRGGNRSSRSNNNNPEGRNQYNSGLMGMARERPAAAAAVAAGAAAAGVFLWSKRGQISDQLSQLSEQIGEWAENMSSRGDRELETVGDDASFSGSTATGMSSELSEKSPGRRTSAATTSSKRRSAGSTSGASMSAGNSGQTPA